MLYVISWKIIIKRRMVGLMKILSFFYRVLVLFFGFCVFKKFFRIVFFFCRFCWDLDELDFCVVLVWCCFGFLFGLG